MIDYTILKSPSDIKRCDKFTFIGLYWKIIVNFYEMTESKLKYE